MQNGVFEDAEELAMMRAAGEDEIDVAKDLEAREAAKIRCRARLEAQALAKREAEMEVLAVPQGDALVDEDLVDIDN